MGLRNCRVFFELPDCLDESSIAFLDEIPLENNSSNEEECCLFTS